MEKKNHNPENNFKNLLTKNKKSYADLLEKVSKKSPFGKKSIFYTPPLEKFSNGDDIVSGLKKG